MAVANAAGDLQYIVYGALLLCGNEIMNVLLALQIYIFTKSMKVCTPFFALNCKLTSLSPAAHTLDHA